MVNPAAALSEATRFAELRQRLLFLAGALVVYRIGTFIPVPGIDPQAMARFFQQQSGTILSMFNMFSGGALERMSMFALGVMPYISASIILQMASAVVPSLNLVKKEGEAGRRKIMQWTRYGTVVLALVQSVGASVALQNQGLAISPGFNFIFTATVTLVTGTMFLMWLGEQITERGVGNGITMIILASIVAGVPSAIGGTLELVNTGEMSVLLVLVLIALVLAVTWAVVFMERGQRRIPVHYAKRQQGRRMYAAQATHLPFKINMSGVIPPIFASSIILFPATIASWFGTSQNMGWLQIIAAELSPGQLMYDLLYGILILFFCFFYTALVFDSRETADNLKRSGAFLPGIRPGQQTAEYIDKVLTRLTFWGALYIAAVCLLPQFMITYWKVPFYFGGTSLLIIVVATMDFMAQLQAHMMSHQYKGLLEKANLRGYGRAGQVR
ncbi:MAG: preprotein translocase subunit SecY [Proteobacteria bacterium]|nr:MAG: preprotein translocase subunit SecY [Pseudomonadota bacterium]MBC6945649.1 preprotein translocase subunit SecY [Gammaproteobacteria bacterium]MCE7896324.1 preprotein translocase subunit SecY [Gammaproteobacteria bacterium PRO8]MDL1881869.1 preprotein translocase subunit SecY [Gammaproteobacteria bacterium PRO2]MCL4777869.1 preprotein translocase subunit SecY [Gammaproteobacteria bacterium]